MIKCHVRLHGPLRDESPVAPGGRVYLELAGHATIADVVAMLKLTGDLRVAVNGDIVGEWEFVLSDGDEIAFFRPVAGG